MENERNNITFMQKNIVSLDEANNSSGVTTIAGYLKIENVFSTELCNKAVNRLLKENDALRLYFSKDEYGNILQKAIEYEEKNIEVISLKETELNEYFRKNAKKHTEILNNYNICSFSIIKVEEKNYGYIYLSGSHMVLDAWTVVKIAEKLNKIYEDLLNNINAEPSKLYSYIEYSKEEAEYEKTDKYLAHAEFWREYLSLVKTETNIKDITENTSTNASRYTVTLPCDISEKVNTFVKENKISQYALFLSVLATYIYRTRNIEDILIGVPILNRSNFKEKQTLGMFISTIPCRIKIAKGDTVLSIAKKIAEDSMKTFRHTRYAITDVIHEMHKNGFEGNLYNVLFSYQNVRNTLISENFSTKWIFSESIANTFEMHITDADNTGNYTLNYDYLDDVFCKDEIKHIHERILSILNNTLSQKIDDVQKIDILPLSEKKEISNILRTTGMLDKIKENSNHVVKIFKNVVKENGNKICLVFEKKHYTYTEIDEKSNYIAEILKEKYNIKKGDAITLLLNRDENVLISILAVLKCGAIYIPIDTSFPNDRIEYILENSKAKAIITNIADKNALKYNPNQILNLNELDVKAKKDFECILRARPICTIYFRLYWKP